MKAYEQMARIKEPAREIPIGDAVMNLQKVTAMQPADSYGGERTILTLSKGQISVPLNRLLPQGVRFFEHESWAFNADDKFVEFNSEELREDPRRILFLLHEIGHANAVMNSPRGEIKDDAKIDNAEDAERYFEDEQAAWIGAFHAMRSLRNEHNIDLFKLFPSADALVHYIMHDVGIDWYEELTEKFGFSIDTEEWRNMLQEDFAH